MSDAEVALPVTQAQWESDGRAAVRAGKPLPSRDPLDRARFELDNAKADEQLTRNAEHNATYYLAETLADTATRDEWRATAEARLEHLRAELHRLASEAGPIVREVKDAIALSHLLGDWGQRQGLYIDGVTPDPVSDLRTLAALREWTPVEVGQVQTIHA